MVPLLAWLLALGNATTALVVYQLLCWGLGLGCPLMVARWLEDGGLSPWWALLLATSTGLAAAIVRRSPGTGALFCMLAALWLRARGRTLAALVLASFAVLGRETSVLVALAIAVAWLTRKAKRRPRSDFGSVPSRSGPVRSTVPGMAGEYTGWPARPCGPRSPPTSPARS